MVGTKLRIGITTPAPPRSLHGNRVTALRWARLLRQLGHQVTLKQVYDGENFDLLIALHARKSHAAVRAFHTVHPARPLLLALTGTDLYQDLPADPAARASLDLATRLILLQPAAINQLPRRHRHKARVIYQSVTSTKGQSNISNSKSQIFRICVVGHLREVKDPFRTAEAARLLPATSRAQIIHLGAALDDAMAARARQEMQDNPRYHWLGEQPRWRARQLIARSHL
jgi:hypothetical protein